MERRKHITALGKTNDPGIFKRKTSRGETRYVVVYYVGGKQKKETIGTMKAARRLKAARTTDRDRGELFEGTNAPLRQYATDWVERYIGNGKRGFSEGSRRSYRRDLERYVYPYFSDRLGRSVSGITPLDVARWIGWLCEQPNGKQDGKLSDATVRRVLAVLSACLASAKREGVIRSNPTTGAALPNRPRIEDEDEDQVRSLSREQLAMFLRVVHSNYRLMFRFIAATGLRFSELIALRWRDLRLDGSEPCVRVRRALAKGEMKAPKSKHGRRDVPLSADLVSALRPLRGGDDELVFASRQGNPPNHANLMRRYLKPAAQEAGVPWAGFHTFRHTCASLLFARGANVVQVQRWLGHHAPSFTLDTYIHLLPGEGAAPLDLDAELRGNTVAIQPTPTDPTPPESVLEGIAL
jgi:integrase